MLESYDIIIIGCGPAGLSAALTCKKLNLKYLVLEKNNIANTIRNYRKDKLIQKNFLGKSDEIKGYLWFGDCKRDELLAKWKEQCKDLNIHENENVIDIKEGVVITDKNRYKARNIVLAIGKQANPRKLDIKGEDKCNILYAVSDATKYKDMNVLIIGGGDAAVEAALALSKENRVTLSYRKEKFFRLTPVNQKLINENKKINIIFNSNLIELKDGIAILDVNGKKKEIKNDIVFLMLGFELPMEFLRKIGIKIVDNKPVVKDYETNIKHLYLIGDLVGIPKIIDAINEGYDVINIIKNA